MPLRAAALLGLIALLALPTAAAAAPADLDRSFAAGAGKAYLTAGDDERIGAMTLQADGRIVVVGVSGASDDNIGQTVARFTAGGAPDGSFSGDGFTHIPVVNKGEEVNAVAVRPNGRIVVAGVGNPNTIDLRVSQLLPGGAPDTSFGPAGQGGIANVDLGGGNEWATALLMRPDGRLVVGGQRAPAGSSSYDFIAAQLRNPQADLDPAYGIGGGWSLANMGGTDDGANAAAFGPGGTILLAGVSNSDFGVTRLRNPEGTFDTGFAAGQSKTFVNFGGQDVANAIAVQPDGRIVVAGTSTADGKGDFAIARLTQAGAIDSSFGAGGKVRVNIAAADSGKAVLLQPNGKILVAGTSGGNFAVARLQPNGQPDGTFGNAGKAVFDLGGAEVVAGAALQSDGKIVVAGESDRNTETKGDFAVIRLQGDAGSGPGSGGGAGKRPRCAGKLATVIGTNRKDRLKGTTKADVIVALGGNDVVDGRGGNDIVCGGSGKDRLGGAAGKDRLFGQAGADRVSGGAGNDLVDGGAAGDRLAGGSGKDKLKGGAGNDRLAGGGAKDSLLGGAGRDRLIGGGGRDLLRGGPGRDAQKQ